MNTRLLALLAFAGLGQAAGAAAVDVYLLAGQSNMQGLGQLAELADDWQTLLPDVWFWNGEDFEPLDPATTRLSSRAGEFGPELGFARGLRALGCEAPLYLIKFHRSGQPLHHGWHDNQWLGGDPAPGRANFYPGASASDPARGSHYRDWLAQCRAALAKIAAHGDAPVLRGVVWMQGEQDSKHATSASQYAASLRRLRTRLGADLAAPDLPWVFGQVLPHEPGLPRFAHRTEIRAQMLALDARSGLPDATPGMRMTPTDKMPLLPDAVHYNTEGQRRLGLAFADDMHRLQLECAAATDRGAPPAALADE